MWFRLFLIQLNRANAIDIPSFFYDATKFIASTAGTSQQLHAGAPVSREQVSIQTQRLAAEHQENPVQYPPQLAP